MIDKQAGTPLLNHAPLLELKKVCTYYGSIQALYDMDVHINKGEIVTLVGCNGAGKTTTLRTISGLQSAKSGSIIFNGQDITQLPAYAIAGLGISHVPEGRGVFPKLTVDENLSAGAFLVKDKKTIQKRREEVYTLFPRLKERVIQKAGTLSGGEQQMLAMGRALMQGGDLLLLDEPSMGLAPVLVDFIFETIVKLNEIGKTILVVEQNARMALEIAHRGYVVLVGNIEMSGDAKMLAQNPEVQKAYLGG